MQYNYTFQYADKLYISCSQGHSINNGYVDVDNNNKGK